MGYDLYGIKATNKKGEYFGNNIWWWALLWDYICTIAITQKIFTQKDYSKGTANDGKQINKNRTDKLVQALKKSITDKTAENYEKFLKIKIKRAKLKNTGKKCTDPKYDWRAEYPFTVQNLKEFIEFAENSGGFKIC